MTPNELDVLGVRVHLVDQAGALARVDALHDAPSPGFVSYVNPHTTNLAYRDPAFGAALASAGLRVPDGFGIRIAARFDGVRVPAILNGTDFNEVVLRHAAARGWPVFLLGGRAGVADRAAERLRRRIDGLRVAGTHDGYFTADDAVVEHVRASGAGVLMVALGQPRQERWLERHLDATGARIGLAVGGFLDFSAGDRRRAPAWMNRAGLEWTFRLAQEPRRLAGRYLLGIPLFLWRISISQLSGRYRFKFRTMSDGAAPGRPAEPLQQPADDPRQTRIGRILRRTHLDELPQLVTGAWQLYRSPDRPVDELVQLDQGYLAQWSPRSDLRLLATTMLHVLRR